jgi:hypothetical protein
VGISEYIIGAFMKRLSVLVVAAVLTQSLGAYAQLTDLPDPGAIGQLPEITPLPPVEPKKPLPPPPPIENKPVQPKSYGRYQSSERVTEISRKTGGLVYRLLLQPAASIRKVTITTIRGSVITHDAVLVSDRGEKISLQDLSNKQQIKLGQTAESEDINFRAPVAAIDIRAEGVGGVSDIKVQVYSDDSRTALKWQKPEVVKPEVAKPAPPAPRVTPPSAPTRISSGIIAVGDPVLETFDGNSLKIVQAIQNGKYLLSDGSWYNSAYVIKLVRSLDGYSVGEMVLESYEGFDLKKISAISANGLYLLTDGSWYHGRFLSKLVRTSGGYSVGDQVLESYEGYDLRKIAVISANGLYLLTDGSWYHGRFLSKVVRTLNGFSVGDVVVESYEGYDLRKIAAISASGLYLLNDGSWYNSRFLSKSVRTSDGISIGQQVIEVYETPSRQRVIAISDSGLFLLQDGQWYNSRFIRRN